MRFINIRNMTKKKKKKKPTRGRAECTDGQVPGQVDGAAESMERQTDPSPRGGCP